MTKYKKVSGKAKRLIHEGETNGIDRCLCYRMRERCDILKSDFTVC